MVTCCKFHTEDPQTQCWVTSYKFYSPGRPGVPDFCTSGLWHEIPKTDIQFLTHTLICCLLVCAEIAQRDSAEQTRILALRHFCTNPIGFSWQQFAAVSARRCCIVTGRCFPAQPHITDKCITNVVSPNTTLSNSLNGLPLTWGSGQHS
jgi:hypothetical protein